MNLRELAVEYLFVDAIFRAAAPPSRHGAKEGVVCAWGITMDGHNVLRRT